MWTFGKMILLLLLSCPIGVLSLQSNYTIEGANHWFAYVAESIEKCHDSIVSSGIQAVRGYIKAFRYCFLSIFTACQTSTTTTSSIVEKDDILPCSYHHFLIDDHLPTLVLEVLVDPAFHVNLTFHRFYLGECTSHEVQVSLFTYLDIVDI